MTVWTRLYGLSANLLSILEIHKERAYYGHSVWQSQYLHLSQDSNLCLYLLCLTRSYLSQAVQ